MSKRSAIRSVTTIAVCLMILGASVTLRASSMSSFCSYWSNAFSGSDNWAFCQSNWDWQWTGGYSFHDMPENEALSQANSLCNDLVFSCWETCGSQAFREAKAQQWTDATGGQCSYHYSCAEPFTSPSCQQGISGSFSCSCSALNVCGSC